MFGVLGYSKPATLKPELVVSVETQLQPLVEKEGIIRELDGTGHFVKPEKTGLPVSDKVAKVAERVWNSPITQKILARIGALALDTAERAILRSLGQAFENPKKKEDSELLGADASTKRQFELQTIGAQVVTAVTHELKSSMLRR